MARGLTSAEPAGTEAAERLLVEAAQKDPARFAELYELHFERVYVFVLRRVRDRSAAEDLTADVFQRALASLPRFEWRGAPFAAWLYRIAGNAVATHFAKAARQAAAPADPPPEAVEREEVEHRARLFRLVNELPEVQRRVIRLRFAEEKSIRRDRAFARQVRRSRQAAPAARAEEPEGSNGKAPCLRSRWPAASTPPSRRS